MLYKKTHKQKLNDWYFTIAGSLRIIVDVIFFPIRGILILCALPFGHINNETSFKYRTHKPVHWALDIAYIASTLIYMVISFPALLIEFVTFIISRSLASILIGPIFLLCGFFLDTKHSLSFLRSYGKYHYSMSPKDCNGSISHDTNAFFYLGIIAYIMDHYRFKAKTIIKDQSIKLKEKLTKLKEAMTFKGLYIDPPQRATSKFLELFNEYHHQILPNYTYLDVITLENFFKKNLFYHSDTDADKVNMILKYYYDELAERDYKEISKCILIDEELNLSSKLDYLRKLISQNKHVGKEDEAYIFVKFLIENLHKISSKHDSDELTIEQYLEEWGMLSPYYQKRTTDTLLALNNPRLPQDITDEIMKFTGSTAHQPDDIKDYDNWKKATIFGRFNKKNIDSKSLVNEHKEDVESNQTPAVTVYT